MDDRKRLTVQDCWFHLQRIDEALSDYRVSSHHKVLAESREFFEEQLAQRLRHESPYRELLELKEKENNHEQPRARS